MSDTDKTLRKSFDFSIESLLKNDSKNKRSDKPFGVMPDSLSIHDVNLEPDSNCDNDNRATNNFSTFSKEELSSCYEELFSQEQNQVDQTQTFSWLNCTRFKPPKLPRSRKRGNLGKRLGRGPRIPFSPHQIVVLENTFTNSQYLSTDCISRLANALHLSETRVKIWFQNRRARYRRERDAQDLPTVGLSETKDKGHAKLTMTANNKSLRKGSALSTGQFLTLLTGQHNRVESSLLSSPVVTSSYSELPLSQPNDDNTNLFLIKKKFSVESSDDSKSPVLSSTSSPSQSEFQFHKFSNRIRDSTFPNFDYLNATNSSLGLKFMSFTNEPKFITNNLSLDASSYSIHQSIFP